MGTIVVVSPKPGDIALANGTALKNTLAGITTASATEPYLIKLGPGVYDLGTTGLVMKQYVSIEGSGEKATKITAAVSSSSANTGTVAGANDAELRFLTVENTGTGTNTIAIYNSSASPSLIHITAIASGAGGNNKVGVYNGVTSSPTMTDVTADASGGITSNVGINSNNSSPKMTNVTASGSGTGSSENYGINNAGASSATMTNVTASGSGGNYSYGVYNTGTSSATMTNVTASGSGGNYSYGVYNAGTSSATMTNVTASGSNAGVYNNSGTVKINHSVLMAIYNAASGTMQVGNSQLKGYSESPGTIACVGLYNNSYAKITSISDGGVFPTTCQ